MCSVSAPEKHKMLAVIPAYKYHNKCDYLILILCNLGKPHHETVNTKLISALFICWYAPSTQKIDCMITNDCNYFNCSIFELAQLLWQGEKAHGTLPFLGPNSFRSPYGPKWHYNCVCQSIELMCLYHITLWFIPLYCTSHSGKTLSNTQFTRTVINTMWSGSSWWLAGHHAPGAGCPRLFILIYCIWHLYVGSYLMVTRSIL